MPLPSWPGLGQFYVRCLASDHLQEDYAMHPNGRFQSSSSKSMGRRQECGERNCDQRRSRREACYAFNDGRCNLQYCHFEHVCSACGGDLKMTVCWSRGKETRYQDRVATERTANSISLREQPIAFSLCFSR